MLLLVLILVVLAFGLLVFAPQAGSVLAAWAAVALSAIAGIVLLIDWMQRRSAMRAGAASLEAAGNRPPSRDREWDHEPEPATEVLPVIPPAGPQQGQFDGPTALTPRADAGGPEQGDDAVDPRFDDVDDSQQTVMMPAVQPPGSSPRPPSAPHGTTGSSGSSSPSVTETESQAGGGTPSDEDETAVDPAAEGDSGTTVLVDTRKRPATEAPTAATERGPDAAADADRTTATAIDADAAAARDNASARPADGAAGAAAAGAAAVAAARAGGADQAPGAPAADPTAAQDIQSAAARKGDSNLSGSDLFGAGDQRSPQAAAESSGQGAQQPPPAQWGPPAGGWQPPSGAEQQPPGVEQANGTQGGQEPATQADGEPTTEQSDPADAALVATLEDEVVVIDEQPRYHVPGCDALTSHEPIPLPAREAVELGFTPCGWCRPNHTLAERHPAATR